MPQPSSSRIDVLTFDRATLSVWAISSAGNARGDRYNSAWICATVRLIPQRVPISPQCKMYCFCTPVKFAISVLSVQTESTERTTSCQLRLKPRACQANCRKMATLCADLYKKIRKEFRLFLLNHCRIGTHKIRPVACGLVSPPCFQPVSAAPPSYQILRRIKAMKKFAVCILSLAMCTLSAFAAQNKNELPKNFLASKKSIHANKPGGLHGKGNIPTPHGFPVGVDSLLNFTDHFEAPGAYFDGSAHHICEDTMVRQKPAQGGTTTINAPVVPVIIDMRTNDGTPAYATNQFGQSVRLISLPDPFIQLFMNAPVFGVSNYTTSRSH